MSGGKKFDLFFKNVLFNNCQSSENIPSTVSGILPIFLLTLSIY